MNTTTRRRSTDIRNILGAAPATAPLGLPEVWSTITNQDYIAAAQLFAAHGTPLAYEALRAIGEDLLPTAYPDLDLAEQQAGTALEKKTVAVLRDLQAEFGRDIPGSLYHLILACVQRTDVSVLMPLFKDRKTMLRDRLWDAVLHAALLVTPVGLHMQSIFSCHGLRFEHVMNCGCNVYSVDEPAFDVSLNPALKPAYLQNMIAAALEQYGVNAATSKSSRGF